MNKVLLLGRLTRDPIISYASGDNTMAIARFTLAVDRRFKREGDAVTADFIGCVAFGKTAEFVDRFAKQGTKFAIEGRIQTGSYTNKEGKKVYTTDVVVENIEFAESKAASQGQSSYQQPQQAAQQGGYSAPQQGYSAQPQGSYYQQPQAAPQQVPTEAADDGFMNIPDGVEDEGLPFN